MESRRTVLYDRHVEAGAKIVDFAGWSMPIQYSGGIIREHLSTRKNAGLFDVSHMGRLIFRGAGALSFLQYVLTNDAGTLGVGQSQYTIISNDNGGAVDDAYLYRFLEGEYLLVVNASNKDKDVAHLKKYLGQFSDVEMVDTTDTLAMLSLQGPESEGMLKGIIEDGSLPDSKRNSLSVVTIFKTSVFVGRTGYTGEPACFELIVPNESAGALWDGLLAAGASPIGLGARDTLRLEAGLPLYGHEFGIDTEGREIPIFACPLARFGVCLDEGRGDFVGKAALLEQYNAACGFSKGDFSAIDVLPQRIRQGVLTGKGISRAGDKVLYEGEHVGYVTSGTMVPYWKTETEGDGTARADQSGMRALVLLMVDSKLEIDSTIDISIRGREIPAKIVSMNLNNRQGRYSFAIV